MASPRPSHINQRPRDFVEYNSFLRLAADRVHQHAIDDRNSRVATQFRAHVSENASNRRWFGSSICPFEMIGVHVNGQALRETAWCASIVWLRRTSRNQAKLSRAVAQLAAFALFSDRVQSGYEITTLVQPSVERDDAASLETRGKSARPLNRAIKVRVSRWIARSVARCVKVDRVLPLRDRAMSNLLGLADVTLASSAERSIHPRAILKLPTLF